MNTTENRSIKKIAIQGFEGCFHQQAAQNYFQEEIEIYPCSTFKELTMKVKNREVDAGVMAIENSIAGSIMQNYRLLQSSRLKITGETYLSIKQNLLALPGTTIDEITEIHSHPMAILQCLDFIEGMDNKNIKVIETEDTALSARHVRDKNLGHVAAIAGDLAGELFKLNHLASNINTVKKNFTRFLILEHTDCAPKQIKSDKASIYFEVANQSGTLLKVLQCFEDNKINMTKLQSYPIPENPFNYMFHADIEFQYIADFKNAINQVREVSERLNICGIYTKAK